ncbi:MAG: fibronectin type III domain-containing protein [Clostridiales Family XIII bacterium]|jgi:hypothetical protein|nr:fibronectin type III domain-containing protein [Clostridiales Family XIII bacterium]
MERTARKSRRLLAAALAALIIIAVVPNGAICTVYAAESQDTATIQIAAAEVKLQKPSQVKLTAKKKSLKIKWTKPAKAREQKITGYQIKYRYELGDTWSNWKTKTYKISYKADGNTASMELKKLKCGKIYQVQVRAYKSTRVGLAKKTYYSAWTKAKKSGRIKP